MESFQGRLDTALERETPEGIALELRPAGVPVRVAAFLIDLGIRGVVLMIAAIVLQLLGDMGAGFFLLTLFLLEWLYPVAFELGRAGATPGKAAMGLKVVMDTGLPVTPGASLARNLLRVADFLPVVYGVGLVCMLIRTDFRRLGDVAAGTLVVHRAPRPPRGDLQQVQPRPPAIPLGPGEQRVLIMLAARAPTLTGERLHELAALAAPVVGDQAPGPGEALTARVLGVAQWLLGRRA
ncbi:MAG: RDD family protein [Pseudomonadota bacterium]|nr:RDD family protein [Pseudomonadota bacterium]